jgi:hypothetical protein
MVDRVAEEPHQVDQAAQEYQGKALRVAQVAQGRILAAVAVQAVLQAHRPRV